MDLQRLYSYTRQAIEKYNMIEEGDVIAIGLSGGKDSLTLLYALAGLKKFYPKSFQLTAVTVDLGFKNFDMEKIKTVCESLKIPHEIIETEIGAILFEARQEKNPCSLCARMRKGAFNKRVVELGCNKIAYAHHKDDFIETMMMSLMFEGHFYAFPPVTELDGNLMVIRPFLLIDEKEIKSFAKKYALPICKNPCPADGRTKRQYMKELILKLDKENPGAKRSMFSAIINGKIPDWPELHDES